MTLNKKTLGGGYLYDTPLVTTLEFQSEGVLCESGNTIDDAVEDDWGTL